MFPIKASVWFTQPLQQFDNNAACGVSYHKHVFLIATAACAPLELTYAPNTIIMLVLAA